MSDLSSIAETSRKLAFANLRPKNAATLILVDRSGPEPKVLMGKRHHSHAFLPERFVFPGGRVELADRNAPAAAPLHPSVEARLMCCLPRPDPKSARAFALAAIRETFEETGIVLGRRIEGATPPAGGPWADFHRNGFFPDLSGLRFIARAITPPRSRRRFDARFFAIDSSAIAHRTGNVVHPGAELTEIVWVSIAESVHLPLPDITEIILQDLKARVAAGFEFDASVPFYRMQRNRFTREMIR